MVITMVSRGSIKKRAVVGSTIGTIIMKTKMNRYEHLVKVYEQYLDCLRAMVKELEEQPSTKYDHGCYDGPDSYMLVGHYTAYKNIKLCVLYQRIREVDKNINRYQWYLKQAS